jgi:hypothetical protein
MFPSFPHYKEDTGGRGQIEPGPLVCLLVTMTIDKIVFNPFNIVAVKIINDAVGFWLPLNSYLKAIKSSAVFNQV